MSYQAACQMVDTLSSEGKWPVSLKKPSATEIIDIFMSRSYWHSHIAKPFGQVARYPLMVDWLKRGEGDMPSDFDVWHHVQPVYTFKELKVWLKNGGTLDIAVKKRLEKAKNKKLTGKDATMVDEEEDEEVVDKKGKKKMKVLPELASGSGSSKKSNSGGKKTHKRK